MAYASTCDLSIPQLPSEFPTTGHVMPGFQENLVGVGHMCDANFTVIFTKHEVNIYSTTDTPIIAGWCETTGPRIWLMSIIPNPLNIPPLPKDHKITTLQAFSAYDLPSVEALIQYFRAASGYPVRDTWLKFIKAGKFASWPGLTYQNAAKACPTTDDTLKVHMLQMRQGIRSTKPRPIITKCKQPEANSLPKGTTPSQELHIKVVHIIKLYTDDTGRFPVFSRSGNH